MMLAVDIGNTNIVLGVYRKRELLHHFRLSTARQSTVDEYGVMIHNLFHMSGISVKDVEGVIISSVVPPLVKTIEDMCIKYIGKDPLIVGPGIKTGLNLRYENPREIGADRIVNAVAAIEQYKCPLVVVDFGTATTFDCIDAGANYLGGAIVPGLGISTEALYQRASKLPRIELEKPKKVIGRNTVHAMQAGIIFGYAGQVEGIVKRIKVEMNAPELKVISTGGLASLIAGETDCIDEVNPMLTLEGLRIIYDRNQ
ncbi:MULTISPECIES: type III pantothenate kinase [Paenibacillus]|jgi:type III pantothenate kinase|uniref:Type III pantothenate kinase n=3 Tax=Paenibacillus odorifer TaxID=189426 RepID=A0A1R0X0N7_9BACL|nr:MULTISPECIES: type III pantothenate kinase [Paenibacillus]AIQ71863.1 transcriptional regulator [Paenibacillus odorifer]AWV31215.1 type III pantothenate kinase [Paenibacillus odorifer]ETT65129.1 putative transcriptional acitvator, Baf family protein [Paenibacillus sp. FSL H8-237]MDH6431386.1 type III pantothenate kinase [Paenibacillus sp. PastH-4]MDH6447452.1 type III pantothenate kinase [Paenibacillus sp. PastF-4]